jgi:siroheme synthase-like protein
VDPADVIGVRVVVAATDDAAANRWLGEASRKAGVLVNVADDPEHCDFYSPAVVRRGPVTVAISTNGGSPLLAGQLRRASWRRRSLAVSPASPSCSFGCGREAYAA